ncbi:6-phosphofructokinase [Bacteroidales bacterium OttesenSCG-928-B11]|nr:6-phosphofructokinase [Bacteroidales bacterium OttesenSCG-928-E04]MDL2312908.1 6-phosphofructokinase [Bacteroidales bacterium OttesenSCG-928-B11]MDL2326392.1 6-phosphofructokinase [Bacteroidales bacterium OttesenSCG-928-A14]
MRTEKLFAGKTLGILSGGGDTPAINSSIESIRNRASMLGFKVYGIQRGWKGLLGDGDIVDLTNTAYNGIYGGTALFSSRTNPFPSKRNPEDRSQQILRNIERYKLDVIVTIGGDDTNGAAKKMYEKYGIPVIGFPKTIDNDLRTKTYHHYQGKQYETVLCPGFPSGAMAIKKLASKLHTTNESHERIMVLEVMGRDAGWLTGTAIFGGAQIALVPEVEMTKERKDFFFEKVKEKYLSSKKRSLLIAVSEGVRWWNDEKQELEMVYASTDLDEYGHPRFGGISGVIASDITKKLGIEARGQISGYIPRAGKCYEYDRRLTSTLADKVVDLLLREDYGKMPVMRDIVPYNELEEFHTDAVDMGNIGNFALPELYYDPNEFYFTEQYIDFLSHIIGSPFRLEFNHEFPVVIPEK